MSEDLCVLLQEAVKLVEGRGHHRTFVEEARHFISGFEPNLEKVPGPPATAISLLLQFIPLLVDSISSDVKLLRNDNGAAIHGLSRAGPFLLRSLLALDETGGEFRHRALDLLFGRGKEFLG